MESLNSELSIIRLVRDKDFALRIFYLFASGFLFYEGFQNWLRGQLDAHPEVVILCVITYSFALVLFTIPFLSSKFVSKFKILPLVALLFVSAFSIYVIAEVQYKGVYRTDSMAFTQYASQLWIFPSWNPYGSDLQKALETFPVEVDYVTLKPSGDLVTNLNYPALHLLFFTPFVYLGVNDMRWVTLIFEIATIILIYWKSPEELRPLILIPLFAGSDLAINFTAGCLGDLLWVLPLTVTAFYLGNPLVAGLSYGLASAVKQEPWILLPFLLTWIVRSGRKNRRDRISAAAVFLGAAVIAFLIPNIFFILKGPQSWFTDVMTPLSGDLLVISQGISTITQKGLVPLARSFYLTLAVVVFLLLIIEYNLYFSDLKNALWVFPAIIMWFSPRGLQNYFVYLIPVGLAAIVTLYRTRGGDDST
jgi:uncharacterized membrane protein